MGAYIIQIIMGIIGSVGFAVLFGIYDRKLIVIAIGSGMGWLVYLLCTAVGYNIFMGLFLASLFVSAISEILARMLKTPVILLLVPMLIPEIPGSDLYYTMYYLLQNYNSEFLFFANKVLVQAAAIALGIIIASYIVKFIESLRKWIKKNNKKSIRRRGR